MSFLVKTPSVSSFEDLNEYLSDLEKRIEEAFLTGEFENINISEINAAPDKPRDGDIINADGTDFDPGSGKGLYFYDTTYNKL
jgi:hypothetical protein